MQHPLYSNGRRKEHHYFDTHLAHVDIQKWMNQFEDASGNVFGDISPSYILFPQIIPSIERIPNVHIIVLLREPSARAISHAGQKTPPNFGAASFDDLVTPFLPPNPLPSLRTLTEWRSSPASVILRGLYANLLEPWLRSQLPIIVLKSEDFFAKSKATLIQICDFIGLTGCEKLEMKHANSKVKRAGYVSEMTKKRLREFYEPHNQRLYALLKRHDIRFTPW